MNDMKPSKDSELYYRYWGKAGKEDDSYHLLPYHCLDVAAVAAVWWEESSVIRNLFCTIFNYTNENKLKSWVLFFIALHDFGKFDVRFQLKAPNAVKQCWPELLDFDVDSGTGFDHGKEGFLWFGREYISLIGDEDQDLEIWDLWPNWVSAVAGHHGEIFEAVSVRPEEYADDEVMLLDSQARREWFGELEKLFLSPVGLSLKDRPPTCGREQQLVLAGFCSICDWLGSSDEYFKYENRSCIELNEYLEKQKISIRESSLLLKAGLISKPAEYTNVQTILPEGNRPRGVQTVVDKLPVGQGLLIIEAPTGSGKTEAALAFAWRLMASGEADSIVFALPTQATANAMLQRIETFACMLFPYGGANIVLAHGKREYNPQFIDLKKAAKRETIQGKDEAGAQCAEWLAQSRKRVFLGQIGVCTIDQVLLSVLPVRHKFVRGFGLNKSILIVDEVHAYDSYMYGLLGEVLTRQKLAGGCTVLLSATLPQQQRCEFIRAWQGMNIVLSNEYPLLTHATSAATNSYYVESKNKPKSFNVAIDLLKLPSALPDGRLYEKIIGAAAAGARVAIICNLVDDAQLVARTLRERTTLPVDLFHARFRFADRQVKERHVMANYGPKRNSPEGRILVATQVIEQSLDLDLDWMVTQLCPIDLLFQRIGRLHRHPLARPTGFERPVCTALSVERDDYGTHQYIYQNPRLLWRTEQVLMNLEGNRIWFPMAYRDLIEQVYQDEIWENEPDKVYGGYLAYRDEEETKTAKATMLSNMTISQFRDEDTKVTALTRDGETGISILPLQSLDDGGVTLDGVALSALDDWERCECLDMNTVTVPRSWEKKLKGLSYDEEGRGRLVFTQVDDQSWQVEINNSRLTYSVDFGMEKEA